jgi:hypothetical protein
MKSAKHFFLAGFILLSSTVLAQRTFTKDDIFNEPKIVWFGIDYTLAKIKGEYAKPGDPLYKTPAQIVEDFFEGWNTVIISEPNKYNLKKTFDKKIVENEIMVAERRNSKVDPLELMTHKEYTIDKEAVKAAVQEYKSFTNKEGIGLVFFTECLNNDEKVATYFVTFFDIATRQVLLCEKVYGKPTGAGLRSYWAGSMVDALADAKKVYKSWK